MATSDALVVVEDWISEHFFTSDAPNESFHGLVTDRLKQWRAAEAPTPLSRFTAARADLRSLRQKVGMVFQQFNLFPHLTVGENVMLAPQVVQKVPKAKAAELARKMLERVGLGEKFDAFPDRLSGGQQQRVAIARALAMSPKVLLCDEITSALDPELVNEVLAVVRQLAKEGMTLIMVTHEMRFAREVGDKLVFMHHGKVHEVGDPKVLFAHPQTAELANFIGTVEATA